MKKTMKSEDSYKIGDTGPGGGKVFYDKGRYSGAWRYLEATPVKMNTKWQWVRPCFTAAKISGTRTAIGTGKKNTKLILAIDAEAPAAKACTDYRGGGKSDWFLPSKDELNELYKTRERIGITPDTFNNFHLSDDFQSSDSFWSSSQGDSHSAWAQFFSDGSQNDAYNLHSICICAVRAF